MFVTYSPGEGDVQEWTVYPAKMRTSEQEAIERAAGMSFAAWSTAVQQGSSLARRALLWVLLRREHPRLAFADVDFAWDELVIETSREEKIALLEAMKKKGAELSAETLAQAQAEIEASRSDESQVGKAPLPIVV